MPLTRYQIRNEYGLADPELYRAADRDDSEALLEGVAMAGLVGVLRQLGDLAEFAAEIFHDLHEEVMATATRGHGLVVRVQQLEADFPSVEKALLSQTSHSSFFSNAGVDWHPNLRSEQSMITRGDLPRFVRDSYEECRGPPRLFLLDKFDVAGAGACLKRYTDPSFFKAESASSITTVEMQREKKTRRVKQKKGSRWRNGGTPEVALTSHAKLQDLFLEERVENGYSDPARLVKLKKRHLNAVDSKTGRSYMKKFVETPSPEHKLVCETSVTPLLLTLTSGDSSEQDLRILDISTVSPAETSPERKSASSSPSIQEAALNPSEDGFNGGVYDGEIIKGSEPIFDVETNKSYSSLHQVAIEKQISGHGEHNTEASIEGSTRTTPSNSDDMTSEVDNYMDALATMDSEMEMDNEYKPKNNLRILNVEKYGTDSDANEEEHLELQTRFSDSQSLGNSSTSDDRNNSSEKDRDSFSHSDTLSNLAPSECNGAPEEFSFNETCGAEVFEMSPSQRLEIVESLEATLKERVVSHDTCIEEDIIPDSRDTSCIVFVGGTSPTLQHSDPGASIPLVSLPEPVLDVTPSDEINGGYRSLDINENGTNVDDSVAVVPDDFSQTKDEPASHPVDDSDVEDLGISSDVFLHVSNVEELASEDQTRNNAANVVFQTHCDDEDSIENSPRRKNSPHLSILPAEEQLFSSALPEVQTSSVNSETIPFVVDAAWSHSSEELYPEGDASQASGVIVQQEATQTYALVEQQDATQTHGLIDHQDATQTNGIDQQFSDSNEDLPQLESISDLDVPHYKEKFIVEESSKTLDDELQLFTNDVDMVGGDTVSVELPSNYPTHPGHGDHVNSGDLVPETLHAEPVADHSAAVAQPDDDVNDVSQSPPNVISSPPRNFMNLHESLPGFGNFLEKESEPDEVVTNSEVQKEASEKEVSPDSESESSKSTAYDHSSSKGSDDGHNFSLDERTENSLAVCVITAESNSSKTTAYDHLSSKVSNEDFSLDERTEYSLAVCDVTAESNPSTSTTYGHSSSKVSDDGHDFSLDEQTQNNSAVHGVTTATEDLEMSNLESESQSMDQSHREDAVATPTCYIPEPGTSLEKSLELQANQVEMEYLPKDAARDKPDADLEQSLEIQSDQLDVECLEEDQASIYLSTTQSAQIGSPAYMDKERSKQLPSAEHINQEICLDASSESCPENLPPQPLTSEFFPESAGQELHDTMQTMEPLDSTLPRLALPHGATAGNREDIPPLPPLPPMQWRMGKQNPSLASLRELVGVSQDSFLPIQPWEADEKPQFDLPAPQRFDMPAPQKFDMPAPQKFDIPEEACQAQNLFLPLASLEDGQVQHASEPLMENMVQPAPYSVHLPTMVKDANHQFNFPDLGGTHFPNPFLSSSEVSDGKSGLSGYNQFASEGEKVQSSSNPFTVRGSECTTSTHDPESSQGATIPPMQKLTQETVSEPNVFQQSMKNSEKEEEKPLATSVTAPAKVVEQPQHSLLTSEGETAWSSNNSAMISDYDVGRTNEIPVSKLPRPRNPLIDAVAAHGQSKLRKVTERVLPQAEPKVDERDSLLQQIRTKSFNLKPATVTRPAVTRPSIPGPTTNLRVAAILEKANAIRQAFAGSDEDEDDDSWSDS